MSSLTDAEIRELAASIGVDLGDGELETIRSHVNENLTGLDRVSEL